MLIGSRWFQFVPKMLFCSAAVRLFQPTMIDTQNDVSMAGIRSRDSLENSLETNSQSFAKRLPPGRSLQKAGNVV